MHDPLKQWDASLTPAQHARLDANLARRRFLLDSMKAAAALSLCSSSLLLSACEDESAQTQARLSQREPWYTFAAAQQQLFPDDGNGPDAKTINATSYLRFVLEAPDTDPDDRKFILDGVDWLNRLAIARYTAVFATCEPQEQQSLLQQITSSQAGERWLSFLLTYLLEALLSDPVYGGNPDGIGWKWLQHIPGFPRPPANKRYVDLL
jgi:gluconate 2-dehydrogenase gamma chain